MESSIRLHYPSVNKKHSTSSSPASMKHRAAPGSVVRLASTISYNPGRAMHECEESSDEGSIIIVSDDENEARGDGEDDARMSATSDVMQRSNRSRDDARVLQPASSPTSLSFSDLDSTEINSRKRRAPLSTSPDRAPSRLQPSTAASNSAPSSLCFTRASPPPPSQSSRLVLSRSSTSASTASTATIGPSTSVPGAAAATSGLLSSSSTASASDEMDVDTPRANQLHVERTKSTSTPTKSLDRRSMLPSSPPATVRKRSAPGRIESAVAKKRSISAASIINHSEIDWKLCDPYARESILLRMEYVQHGNLEYKQTMPMPKLNGKAGPSRFVSKQPQPPAQRSAAVSWANSVDASALHDRIDRGAFTATCWVRDILSSVPPIATKKPFEAASDENTIEDEGSTKHRGLRKQHVNGVEFRLLGLEFPMKSALIVGTIVSVTRRSLGSDTPEAVMYMVDDSTSIIECMCELASPAPILSAVLIRAVKEGLVKAREPLLSSGLTGDLQVGMLVRVIGEVIDAKYNGGPLRMLASKIESIADPNVEAQHHLTVARLHAEVYSQRVDVAARLNKIILDEREEEKDWRGSQATASVAGTPKKTKKPPKFPHPSQIVDFTLDIFIGYILEHLSRHHSKANPSIRRDTSNHSPVKSLRSALLFDDDDDNDDDEDEPLPPPLHFTLQQLETTKSMRICAEILAQKMEKDRLAKRKTGVVATQGSTDVFVTATKGLDYAIRAKMNHGLGTIIAPPRSTFVDRINTSAMTGQHLHSGGGGSSSSRMISSAIPGKSRMESKSKRDHPLQGHDLQQAMSKQFKVAIVRMCKRGQIVVADECALSLPPLAEFLDGVRRGGPRQPNHSTTFSDGSYGSSSEEEEKEYVVSVVNRPYQYIRQTFKSPWDSESDAEESPATPKPIKIKNDDEKKKTAWIVKKHGSTTTAMTIADTRAKKVGGDGDSMKPIAIALDMTDDENAVGWMRKKVPRKQQQRQSTSVDCATFLRGIVNKSVSRRGTDPIKDHGMPGMMMGYASEIYEVVNPTLLCPYILDIVIAESFPNDDRGSRAGHYGRRGGSLAVLEEEKIRACLANDDRWRAVYARSSQVSDSIAELVSRGYLESVGKGVQLAS